jgi:hypothetical protein
MNAAERALNLGNLRPFRASDAAQLRGSVAGPAPAVAGCSRIARTSSGSVCSSALKAPT